MGPTVAKIKVYNPYNESKCLDLELLTDTGSTYTWVRRSRLENIDIKPIEKVKFKAIDNRIIERDISEAVVKCMNRKATTIVVFADESDNEVLGLHALEGLRLEVDPVTKQLKEVEAVLAL
jgi:predicted aspartyl protease